MAAPDYDQMKTLCTEVDTLLTSTNQLRTLFQTNPQALDRYNQAFPAVQHPAQLAILAQSEPAPRPEYIVTDFLYVDRRKDSFDGFFDKVKIIASRTELARIYFQSHNEYTGPLLYPLQTWVIKRDFSDHQDLSRKVSFYTTVASCLISLF